jgi:hypothetical protein
MDMITILGIAGLILLLPITVVVLLRHIDNAEDIDKKETQKLLSEALGSM